MNNKYKEQPRRIKSGEMMQGICSQWIVDEHGSNSDLMRAMPLYMKIVRKTFGYRNRWGYMPQHYFKMHTQQLKTHRDILTKYGLLEWHKTKMMTMYKILEPKPLIKSFVFIKTNTETLKQEDEIQTEL